jgi:hypothetical protein
MTERQFLERQSRRIRDRIRRGSASLHDEIERAVGPTIREHPRLSLAASASAGLLIGRILAAPSRRRDPRARPGMIAGGFRFIKETGIFALRSTLVNSLRSAMRNNATGV